MDNQVNLKIINDLSQISKVRNELEIFCEKFNISSNIIYKIKLALDEVLSNIISYAYYDNNEHEIIINIYFESPYIIIEIIDDGYYFDPLNVPTPNIDCDLDERKIGGWGIFLIRKMIDIVKYIRNNNKNILILKKNIFN